MFKILVVFTVAALCCMCQAYPAGYSSDVPATSYGPSSTGGGAGGLGGGYGGGAGGAGGGGAGGFAGHSNPNDVNAEVGSLVNELKEDGSYNYQFDTTNGIVAQESGVGGHYASGSSQYYSPEGQLIQLTYTADEHGFHPEGDHLPTPPPIPEAILKALEYIRQHPEENEEGGPSNQYLAPHGGNGGAGIQAPSNQYLAPQQAPSNQYLAPQRVHKV